MAKNTSNNFLKSIKLTNFLSYGSEGTEIKLRPLNVFIGANASGKSNMIEALRILRAAPQKGQENKISAALSKGGGVSEWIWKGGGSDAIADVEVITDSYPDFNFPIRYTMKFRVSAENKFDLWSESLIRQKTDTPDYTDHQADYYYESGSPPNLVTYINKEEWEKFKKDPTINLGHANVDDLDLNRSILSQRDDLERFPNIHHLANQFRDFRIYREWNLGIDAPVRNYQRTDEYQDFLLEDASNLALILHYLLERTDTTILLYENLEKFSISFDQITSSIRGGGIKFFIHEKGFETPIPSSRLSEGYIRFLCLLAILCHPEPPPIICIEEPEQCMHPDIIHTIAELLVEASKRTQIFVTTHSDYLVSALTDTPESVIVCDKLQNGTHLQRLEKDKLEKWLVKYTLGELWTRGEIGGVT